MGFFFIISESIVCFTNVSQLSSASVTIFSNKRPAWLPSNSNTKSSKTRILLKSIGSGLFFFWLGFVEDDADVEWQESWIEKTKGSVSVKVCKQIKVETGTLQAGIIRKVYHNNYFFHLYVRGFIDIFSRRATSFHRQEKLLELNYTFLKMVKRGRQNHSQS